MVVLIETFQFQESPIQVHKFKLTVHLIKNIFIVKSLKHTANQSYLFVIGPVLVNR